MCWTTMTAPGKSLGKYGANFISVAGPPVDEATTTTGNFPPRDGGGAGAAVPFCTFCPKLADAGSLLDEEVASCGMRGRGAVRTTRTLAAILSLRQISSFTRPQSRPTPPLRSPPHPHTPHPPP